MKVFSIFKPRFIIVVLLVMFSMSFIVSCGTSDNETAPTATPKEQNSPASSDSGPAKNSAADKYADLIAKSMSHDNYSFEMVMKTKDNQVMNQKVWVKGRKIKSEFEPDMGMVMYCDLDKQEVYTYNKMDKSVFKADISNSSEDYSSKLSDLKFNDVVDKGIVTINGKSCVVFEKKIDEQKAVFYISKQDGFILKSEMYTGDNLETEVTFNNYEQGKVTDEMVSLPADVKL